MWWNKLLQIWKIKDLRKKIIFVLLMLVVFRIGAHIPVPGINTDNLREFFDQSQLLGLLNLFSGGTMENFSIMALGIAPYITASIIFQLLGGIRSGMGYTGSKDIATLRTRRTSFIRSTPQGLRESHVHDVIITEEAPNYRLEP